MFVPVVDSDQKPLMPTTPSRARRWIKSGLASGFFKKGVFCVRLNVQPSAQNTQPIAVGIDPGSKKEGFTVKSKSHTYLNIQVDTPPWTGERVKNGSNKGKNKTTLQRAQMRRSRRYRKTPYRQCRPNRNANKEWMSPSTRSRWELKVNICKWLVKMFPVTDFVVEDIKARTWKKAKKWNLSFSPLEVGKKWFYCVRAGLVDRSSSAQIIFAQNPPLQIAPVTLIPGVQTYEMRNQLGLKKTSKKLAEVFEAHCVDSWVLAHHIVGGKPQPDNTRLVLITPHNFCRRHLQRFKAQRGGIRTRYGGTQCAGFKKGSLVKHPKYGLCYVSGYMESPTKKEPQRKVLSLYSLETGFSFINFLPLPLPLPLPLRLTQKALTTDCSFIAYTSWRTRYV